MYKCRYVGKVMFIMLVCLWVAGCDPFQSRDVPEDISGTWGGAITEGLGYYNITLRLSNSGTLVTGSWTSNIRGIQETGGLTGNYYDGKANLSLSIGSAMIGNMMLRFDDDSATGEGTERGKDFTVTIKKI